MNSSIKLCLPAKELRRASRESDRGSALFIVLILAVVMASMLGAVLTYLNRAAQLEKRSNARLEATYAAEYAFEQAFSALRTQIGQYTLPDITRTTDLTNLSKAPVGVFKPELGYSWKTYLTVPVGDDGAVVDEHSALSTVFGTYRYITAVELERSVPTMKTPVRAGFQQEWIYTFKPLFQYAIFYDGDMELFPGAAFVVTGRVHSNGRIYTGTTASITYRDFVTDVDGVSTHYHPDDPRTEGTLGGSVSYVKGPPTVTTREEPPGALVKDTTDANHNNDGARELIEIPNAWQTDPGAEGRLYTKAGLKVLVNSTNTAVTAESAVSVPAKQRVYMTEDGTIIPSSDPIATVLNTVFSDPATAVSVKDYREGSASVTVTQVSVDKLTAAYDAGGLPATIPTSTKWPNNSSVPDTLKNKDIPEALRGKALWNGIVYVADVTDSETHPVAVKLINGESLPDGTASLSPKAGLTIVSENAAYIVGDYNTGGTPPVNNASNELTAKNYATGYAVQPSAVIADAVTIMSSKWDDDDYNSKSNLNERTPVNTTINTALISGIVPTTEDAYSGGVENYLRLLENWSSKRLTYYGSIINLYASQQAKARWQTTGIYYNAPVRNWYFDTQFKDPKKLPPGTPTLRSVQRGQWVQLE